MRLGWEEDFSTVIRIEAAWLRIFRQSTIGAAGREYASPPRQERLVTLRTLPLSESLSQKEKQAKPTDCNGHCDEECDARSFSENLYGDYSGGHEHGNKQGPHKQEFPLDPIIRLPFFEVASHDFTPPIASDYAASQRLGSLSPAENVGSGRNASLVLGCNRYQTM
jgi:hypothetical protein